MSSLLHRVGAASATRPWRVIGMWVTLVLIAFGLAAGVGGSPQDNYTIPGVDAQAGTDLLTERFVEFSGADARIVVHSDTGKVPAGELTTLSERLSKVAGVSAVAPPRVSADGDTALIDLSYSVPVTDFSGTEGIDALRAATAPTEDAGYQVELGGQIPENISAPSGVAEAIGIVVALIILVFAFGSIVAAGLPLAVAFVGVGIGSALITVMAGFTDISNIAPTVATMVGIGIGIDYALLLVTRYAEGLRGGMSVVDAAARANATAGMSVIFAGTTVLVSLFGLKLAGIPVYSSFGYATFAMVASVMLASVTLVPALCGLAGHRVLSKRSRKATAVVAADAPRVSKTELWATRVGEKPWPFAVAALLLLLLLAAPVLQMRTWPQDSGSQPTSNTTRLAYDIVSDEFGPGANGPFIVAIDLDHTSDSEVNALVATFKADPGVAQVSPVIRNAAGTAAIVRVEAKTGPQDAATPETLTRLRSALPETSHVTGLTAIFSDISNRLADRLWLVIAVVVTLAVILMTVVFRAPVVALKAAAMNLLSVAAAYGVMVAVFQWGWGAELLGLPHEVPVSSWVPILMFTILFGLSMDYEVFLLSRVRELWLKTGDAHTSVIKGLASTGRVITSAGAIMIAVFAGFAMDSDITVKMMGVGLATAVLVDVTIVRMVLVPATMSILGKANWWIPAWLDRVLPKFDVEGSDQAGEPAPKEPINA
ncbi:MMPL family transporter [Antrihabitans sp. YC3-6]|uniref:MMPL family transporter n=1 Tax=Antrihabitans stalagmiti TaxID=2799499 RepID=A0A934NTG0_9NOCA|nr:MMPL family transporter [Antrihabitans stalagmiti]MBJ8340865.1 MMPL family transporter [Antrihabitans stalagmiti]